MINKLPEERLIVHLPLPLSHNKQSGFMQENETGKPEKQYKSKTTNNANLFLSSFQSDKTALMVTIGPTSDSIDTLVEMAQNGMNVIRVNFSHCRTRYEIWRYFPETGTLRNPLHTGMAKKIKQPSFNHRQEIPSLLIELEL